MVAFKGTSGYGNNLYVDDIQILDGTTISVEENDLIVGIDAFPNPTSGDVSLTINLNENALVNVSVFNNLGQLVVANTVKELTTGTSVQKLNLTNLENGIYFAHITVGAEAVVKQITLLK
jgi:hypothetical protein